ncbi:MAG: FtsW/RodA/SpoVE family cell cycle protein, partial [Chloroflexi bacterium]|nr:FtsW/RodA/SpoVE family cell cycle protein [Chloroflexota bacterium]
MMKLAGLFMFLFSLTLTVSPAARIHSWDAPYRWLHWIGFFVWLACSAILHRLIQSKLPDRDPYILPVALLLAGWGLLTIWRLDAVFGLRQSAWLGVGTLAIYLGLRVPRLLFLLRKYKYIWLTGGLLLTAMTFLFGTYPGGEGPRLWLGCCGIYMQPSEPLKLLLVVYLSAYFADRLRDRFSLIQLLSPTLILAGAALVILLAQRDLGTASIFITLYFLIVYLVTGKKRILLFGAAVVLIAGLAGYQLFDVIRLRVDAWLNPWADSSGRSYQIVQSLIAIAAGGVFGSGAGLGSPSLVPVAHSDFIFASIAEEFGLVGITGLIVLIALLVSRCLRTALYAPNRYQRFLAAGLGGYFTVQSILIIGGNLRLVPLTGVTLPFVSYGGSSLVTSFLSILLLLLISSRTDEAAPLPDPQPYTLVSSGLLLGLGAVALIGGWWGFFRAGDLQSRTDNPRWAIADRYSPRGAILDRNNGTIVQTTGEAGDYTRQLLYPQLSPVTGYTHPAYGQTGLEASMDGYLRGMEGTPTSTIWSYELLYAQHPPGLDLRLSIDLDLQKIVDEQLGDHRGAVVALNARTGEVLVMASHPNIDPNQIDAQWDTWIQEQSAPLINRATQGLYPPGTALAPFFLAQTGNIDDLPALPGSLGYISGDLRLFCLQSSSAPTWATAITGGCP